MLCPISQPVPVCKYYLADHLNEINNGMACSMHEKTIYRATKLQSDDLKGTERYNVEHSRLSQEGQLTGCFE
jgi:hypothetical protein